jgi:hypothetical protein
VIIFGNVFAISSFFTHHKPLQGEFVMPNPSERNTSKPNPQDAAAQKQREQKDRDMNRDQSSSDSAKRQK